MNEADYYDIDDIISETELVKVRFLKDISWTGAFELSEELSNGNSTINNGTVLQLPLWLARALAECGSVTILPPRQFGVRIRADLAAQADAVNLHELCPNWYRLGIKVGKLLPGEGISRMMKGALAGRLGYLSKAIFLPGHQGSVTANDPHQTIFGARSSTSILDNTEEEIFLQTIAAKKEADAWAARKTDTFLINKDY